VGTDAPEMLSLRLSCSGLRALDGENVFTGLFALEFIHVPVVSVPTAQVQRDPALQNYLNGSWGNLSSKEHVGKEW
jgi:hypothetical protein